MGAILGGLNKTYIIDLEIFINYEGRQKGRQLKLLHTNMMLHRALTTGK